MTEVTRVTKISEALYEMLPAINPAGEDIALTDEQKSRISNGVATTLKLWDAIAPILIADIVDFYSDTQ